MSPYVPSCKSDLPVASNTVSFMTDVHESDDDTRDPIQFIMYDCIMGGWQCEEEVRHGVSPDHRCAVDEILLSLLKTHRTGEIVRIVPAAYICAGLQKVGRL